MTLKKGITKAWEKDLKKKTPGETLNCKALETFNNSLKSPEEIFKIDFERPWENNRNSSRKFFEIYLNVHIDWPYKGSRMSKVWTWIMSMGF